MVLLLQDQHVPVTMQQFVLLVMVGILKLIPNALNVNLLVVPEQENQLIVLHHLIVYVLKMCVLVPMVLLLLKQLVLHTVPRSVCPVSRDTTKLETLALNVLLLVVLVLNLQPVQQLHNDRVSVVNRDNTKI